MQRDSASKRGIQGAPPEDGGRGERARRRLLDVGIEVFAQFGPEEVSIRRLAAAAGVNSAALSYYFGGKDGYYHAVLQHLADGVGAKIRESALAVRRVSAGPLSPQAARQALRAFLRRFVTTVLTEPGTEAVATIVWREMLRPSDGFEIVYRRMIRPVHEIITELAATALGTQPSDPHAIVLAHSLWGQAAIFRIGFHVLRRRLRCRGKRLSQNVIAVITDTVDAVVLRLLPDPSDSKQPAEFPLRGNGRRRNIRQSE
ncbi:MAG: CerR family C-terminal domain-containing protein [Thermogutta sp.]